MDCQEHDPEDGRVRDQDKEPIEMPDDSGLGRCAGHTRGLDRDESPEDGGHDDRDGQSRPGVRQSDAFKRAWRGFWEGHGATVAHDRMRLLSAKPL